MRLAHLTDLHFYHFPGLYGSLGKRLLGLANLYLNGRRHHFDPESVHRLVAHLGQTRWDAIALTGDLTAMAHPEEFRLARMALAPLTDRFPTAMVPGNHDIYTWASAKSGEMERLVGDWMRGGRAGAGQTGWSGGEGAAIEWPVVWRLPGLRMIGLNPCRPSLASSGTLGPAQLARLKALLAQPDEDPWMLLVHYPLVHADGSLYDQSGRSMTDAPELIELLADHDPVAILHGHHHAWYTASIPGRSRPIPIINCGTSGWTERDPERTAGYFDLEIEAGRLVRARRFELMRGRFEEIGDFLPGRRSAA